MQNSKGSDPLDSIIFVILMIAVAIIVHFVYGQTASVRMWGMASLVVSIIFTFKKSIPVSFGNRELKPLEGWRKAYFLIPAYANGLLTSLFPHEVACAIHLKNYVC